MGWSGKKNGELLGLLAGQGFKGTWTRWLHVGEPSHE
jgi:hypothetical protein